MLNLILFGAPGSGKGTQSERIKKKYNLIHISTGDLFRKHLKENTHLGKIAQKYMDKGILVPDKLVMDMIEKKLPECIDTAGIIFDGFPRTVLQAEFLGVILNKYRLTISGVTALEVPVEELKQRLLLRGKSSKRSDDIDEKKISTRIKIYNREISALVDYYSKQKKLYSVQGTGKIEEISHHLIKIIDSLL